MPGDGFCCPRVGRLGCATRQANRKALSLSTRSTRRPAWSTTPTSATGTAWRRTPWRATQVAAFMLSCTHMEGPFRDHESSEIPFGQVLQHRDQGVALRYPATVDRGIRELLPGGTQAKVRLLELFLLTHGQSVVSWPGSGERQAAESTRCIRRVTRTVVERTQRGDVGVDEATKIPSVAPLAVVHGYERWALRKWLDSWPGIDVAVGMHRQGCDLQLTQYDAEVGARRSTRPAWSTRPPTRPAPRGSRRRGTRRSGRLGRP